LDQRGSVIAEYVWIDANGGTRSKCKVSIHLPNLPISSLQQRLFTLVLAFVPASASLRLNADVGTNREAEEL
jgi:hypothetical protein